MKKQFVAILLAVLLVILIAFPAIAEKIILPSGPRVITAWEPKEGRIWDGGALALVGFEDYVYFDTGFYTIVEVTTPMIGFSANILNVISLIPKVDVRISDAITLGVSRSWNFRDNYWMTLYYVSVDFSIFK